MAWNEPGGGRNPQDPWGNRNRNRGAGSGGGGGGGLDDLLRRFLDRVGSLFGGGGGGEGAPSMVGPILAMLGIIWVAMGVYRFDQAEQGVVLRFGKYHDTVGAGLHWYPWLIDEVRRVNVSQLQQSQLAAQMITADQNLVDIQLTVQYRVGDARAYLLRVENAESILGHATESALRHVVGNSKLNEVISEGRANLAIGMTPRLQSYLDRYQTGLVVSQVNLAGAQAPKEVSDAFYDVDRAKVDKERLISEAQAYANSVVPEARGKAQRMLQEAEAYKQDLIARAEGDAARFNSLYAEYRKSPKVTRDRLYIETMQEVYGKSSKVMLDTQGTNLVNLPLDQLIGLKSGVARADAAAAATVETPAAAATVTPERAVDRLRARREENR